MEKLAEKSNELTAHFFRHEYSKMVAVITRYFGLGQLNLAEDIVQDTLLEAITSWDYNGIPDNPAAWLYTVAKNKALPQSLTKPDSMCRPPPRAAGF